MVRFQGCCVSGSRCFALRVFAEVYQHNVSGLCYSLLKIQVTPGKQTTLETSCAEVHFLPTATEARGESWKMTDGGFQIFCLVLDRNFPCLFTMSPLRHTSSPLQWQTEVLHTRWSRRQIIKSHRIACHIWPTGPCFLGSRAGWNPQKCFWLCERWNKKTKSQLCSFFMLPSLWLNFFFSQHIFPCL